MRKAYGAYLAALLLFGFNGVTASRIHLSSYEIVTLRSVLGGALLLALFLATGHRFTVQRHRRDMAYIAVSGAAMGAEWLLLYEAYDRIGVGLAMLINYTGPAIVIALSPLLLRERVTPARVTALAAALAGACCISWQAAAAGLSPWGLLCAGLSAVGYAAMVLADKKAQTVVGLENAVVQLLCAAAVVTVFTLCRQGPHMDIPAGDWPYILLLGLVNTGIGCGLYFSSIGRLPAQSVAVCGYLEPLFAVVLSAVLLHEGMTPLRLAGAVLIVGGAVYGECRSARQKSERALCQGKGKMTE